MEQFHQIYHMLDVSLYDRPQWDLEVLQKLGVTSCEAALTVRPRLYPIKDEFFIPEPLFGVYTVK